MKGEKLIYENIINNPHISEEQKLQEKKYKEYIDNHKKNVVETWNEIKRNKIIFDFIKKEGGENIDKIIDKSVLVHDNSKFSEEEWEPYRKHFFSLNNEEKNDSKYEFNKAWAHHKKNNTHHHEHWEEIGQNDKMPFSDVVEMCCDWISMSKVFGGQANIWYKSQKNIFLGETQKNWAEFILNQYYN